MSEIKNTFLKSKMNKDLDSRIIPNGEYRDAKNVSISTSEGSDVGALENIRGNFSLTNFGLTDFNLEVIGTVVDTAKNRIYFFITNFVDGSTNQLENLTSTNSTSNSNIGLFTRTGAKNCIAYCEVVYQDDVNLNSSTIVSNVLVEGAFLNFSKTHPMTGVNILEDLLFFTDNRNQPRKINVETAISNPLTYYTHEDHVSVAKYAPYLPIGFLDTTVTPSVSTLKNEVDEWLPASFIAPGLIFDENVDPGVDDVILFSNDSTFGDPVGQYASPMEHFGSNPSFDIRIYSLNDENSSYAYVRSFQLETSTNKVKVRLKDSTLPSANPIIDISDKLGWTNANNKTYAFEIRNPSYNLSFSGDKDLLREKFVKFSYRFKYDDNEYSLIAPFSQHAFIPKQYGYFIGDDDEKTKESSIVDFMENQVTTAGLVIDLPFKSNELKSKLKVKELQILYKESDETSLKVISDIKVEDISSKVSEISIETAGVNYTDSNNLSTVGGSGTGLTVDITTSSEDGSVVTVVINNYGSGYLAGDTVSIFDNLGTGCVFNIVSLSSTFIHNYSSQKPIKVLDDQEVIRVNDITPLRAQTQEVVGNRIVYGNFLQNNETPLSLSYEVTSVKKGNINTSNKKEFLNHTLKQGRTYQVGIVLQDRYGRSSNVIINDDPRASVLNSTFFAPYGVGVSDTLRWPGNSLRAIFNEKIPSQKTNTYNGVWQDNVNPLGWYSYKLVVKQQDQDYYNVYTPGSLSGNVNFKKLNESLTYSETSSISHIALFNDNINKIPRDLKEVGPTDKIYSSSSILYSRVKNNIYGADNNAPDINEQNHIDKEIEVTTVKPFVDFGEWTTMKNVDVNWIDAKTNIDDTNALIVTGPYIQPKTGTSPGSLVPKYIYPGPQGQTDPFFLKNNKNPLIATLSTKFRVGYTAGNQEDNLWKFSKKLNVFETKPFKSEIDIYYESSSSGLISEFNNEVDYPTGPNGQPTGISPFTPRFKESANFPVDVSNIFFAVDSNGNQITDNSPTITILEVRVLTGGSSTGASYTPTVSPFDLVVAQAPGFNIPATYKLTTNSVKIYSSNDNYEIDLIIKADGKQDVIQTVQAPLTNVKPIIYKSITTPFEDFTTNYFLENKSSTDINAFTSGTAITIATTDVPGMGSLEPYPNYQVGINVKSSERSGINRSNQNFVCYISHLTNGSGFLTQFNEFNDNSRVIFPAGDNSKANRNQGIIYEIKKATRYNANYYDDYASGKMDVGGRVYSRYGDNQSLAIQNSMDVTPAFKTVVKPENDTCYIYYDFIGTINKSDIGGKNGAWLYFVEVLIKDAGGVGIGWDSSETYNIYFLIRN